MGELLIAALIVAMVALAALAGYPTLAAQADDTASRAQERANMPFAELDYLENGAHPSSTQVEFTYSP